MSFSLRVLSVAVLVLLLRTSSVSAAGNPAPGPTPTDPDNLPQNLAEVVLIVLDLSWDFGDVQAPDWRKEISSADASERFIVRWSYTGPDIDSAALLGW